MTQPQSFFLAGTMQGARPGAELLDQGYRVAVRLVIERRYPTSVIHCPLEIMQQRFANNLGELQGLHSTLSGRRRIVLCDLHPQLRETCTAFHDLLHLVANSDVLVACLPNHEPSMGTAMEMLEARHHRRPVIAITKMQQNLAVLATSNVIVPDIEEFDLLLASGWLESFQVS